jgi:hypothetical protein
MGMYESFRDRVLQMLESGGGARAGNSGGPVTPKKRKREALSSSVPLPSPSLTPDRRQPQRRTPTPSPSKPKKVFKVECGIQDLKLVLPGTSGHPESHTYCYLVPSTSGLVTQYQVGLLGGPPCHAGRS